MKYYDRKGREIFSPGEAGWFKIVSDFHDESLQRLSPLERQKRELQAWSNGAKW